MGTDFISVQIKYMAAAATVATCNRQLARNWIETEITKNGEMAQMMERGMENHCRNQIEWCSMADAFKTWIFKRNILNCDSSILFASIRNFSQCKYDACCTVAALRQIFVFRDVKCETLAARGTPLIRGHRSAHIHTQTNNIRIS